jgi:hypothetical protein
VRCHTTVIPRFPHIDKAFNVPVVDQQVLEVGIEQPDVDRGRLLEKRQIAALASLDDAVAEWSWGSPRADSVEDQQELSDERRSHRIAASELPTGGRNLYSVTVAMLSRILLLVCGSWLTKRCALMPLVAPLRGTRVACERVRVPARPLRDVRPTA